MIDARIALFQGYFLRDGTCASRDWDQFTVSTNNRTCPEASDLRFFAKADTAYWFVVYGQTLGRFALTVKRDPRSHFAVIDSIKDKPIDELRDKIEYYHNSSFYVFTPRLNIQATFAPEIPTKSVLVTFDNPNVSSCEWRAPYTVFGDYNGDFYNATIPLGTHVVTATPYAQANCMGPPGETLTNTFSVTGCYAGNLSGLPPSNQMVRWLESLCRYMARRRLASFAPEVIASF
jgi:hypothetical protein